MILLRFRLCCCIVAGSWVCACVASNAPSLIWAPIQIANWAQASSFFHHMLARAHALVPCLMPNCFARGRSCPSPFPRPVSVDPKIATNKKCSCGYAFLSFYFRVKHPSYDNSWWDKKKNNNHSASFSVFRAAYNYHVFSVTAVFSCFCLAQILHTSC